jgi:[ribosomal protein S5]-alanine N-acetyltransferase
VGAAVKNAFLIGDRLFFRPVEMEDLAGDYHRWLNDPQVTRGLETGLFPVTLPQMEEYLKGLSRSSSDAFFAIVTREDERMIGTIKLGFINWINRTAELGILIGASDCWGKGYGVEACRMLVRYGFECLNLHKISLGVIADHSSAIRCYEKVGFVQEGCLRSCLYRDGKYHDKIMMGILADEFRGA